MSQPFGKRLKQQRLQRGWTLKELAQRSGLSISHISSLERGVRVKPSFDAAKRLADALGITIDYFLNEDSSTIETVEHVLNHLPQDLRAFILNENSAPYLSFAKKLSDRTLSEPEIIAAIAVFIQEVQSIRKSSELSK